MDLPVPASKQAEGSGPGLGAPPEHDDRTSAVSTVAAQTVLTADVLARASGLAVVPSEAGAGATQIEKKSAEKQAQPSSYRPDVDGLRALSVVAVTLYHLNEHWLPGGFCGVDVFFVISGYVVTSSLRSHWRKLVRRREEIFVAAEKSTVSVSLPGGVSRPEDPRRRATWSRRRCPVGISACAASVYTDFLLDFYARRVQRLYPALVATFWCGTMMIAFLVPYWCWSHYFWGSAGSSLVGGANVYYAIASVDYCRDWRWISW